ncbi:DNA polymerase [Cupriavidus gilardii J11]|uniref:Type-4 uracil-DNA glycosylase n=1 Tax=Cupriavidus gilardii J11 TaxID=936133 RepID=A0A562B3Q4_9BURK|nr:uracil-DNA glycosylase [Cupriavidus gilardii]TWG79679.1 DNA polymerase [Cupriavidus gilardii J11]
MNRRALMLEALGIGVEWVPKSRQEALVESDSPLPRPVSRERETGEEAVVVERDSPVPRPLSRERERGEDVAALDWAALEARVAECTACEQLCATRTQTVFGVGDRQAEWMLVGEAPGENEDLKGEPFVGQAGKLLDNMLAALGLARGRNVYIANVLKCRPPGNRNPEPSEVEQCEAYLRRQIALVQPRLIVVLGRFAAQTLLRSTAPISKLRGTVHRYEGIPVVVTYHPAYLLRTLTDKARAWEDLCMARDVHRQAAAPGGATLAPERGGNEGTAG